MTNNDRLHWFVPIVRGVQWDDQQSRPHTDSESFVCCASLFSQPTSWWAISPIRISTWNSNHKYQTCLVFIISVQGGPRSSSEQVRVRLKSQLTLLTLPVRFCSSCCHKVESFNCKMKAWFVNHSEIRTVVGGPVSCGWTAV